MSKKDDTFEMLDDMPKISKKSIILLFILVIAIMGGISTYFPRQSIDQEASTATVSEPIEKETPAPIQTASTQVSVPISAVVNFDEASANINPDQMQKLQAFYQSVKDLAGTIQINGYTDNMGLAQYGLTLSKQRAEAVAAYLNSLGSDAKIKFVVDGFGENDPVGDNSTTLGRQQNRRVELKFIPAP